MDAHLLGTTPGLAAPELAHHDVVGPVPLGTAPARAVVTATNERAPNAANVEGPVQTETQCLIFKQPDDDGKRFATLQAELARQAYCLHELADGSYLVTRWNCCRPLADLRAVAAFVRQVGGAL